jgi:hypothetical protein
MKIRRSIRSSDRLKFTTDLTWSVEDEAVLFRLLGTILLFNGANI